MRTIISAAGRRGWIGILVFVACVTWTHAADAESAAGELVLAERGASEYVIVVPDHGDLAGRIEPAARLLRDVVKEATGANLPIAMESAFDGKKPAIYLCKSKAAAKAGLPLEKVERWSYLHQVVGDDVFIIGDDRLAMIDRDYNPKSGKTTEREIEHDTTRKAVIDFLEIQLGAGFYLPGDYGRRVPKVDRFAVKRDLKTGWKFPFDFIQCQAWKMDRDWSDALNLFTSGDVFESYGGHSYYSHVPASKYGKKRPEYFALFGDTRTPEKNHLCISNPDVQRIMIEEMEKKLDSGYQSLLLSQTDGYRACECAQCRAIHPDYRERVWIVHRKLAEEMSKRRPGKKIAILSYPPTDNPPTSFSTFPDNTVVMICRYNRPTLEAFDKFDVAKIVYTYNWGWYKTTGNFGPVRTPDYLQDELDLFVKYDVRGIYVDGGFRAWSAYGMEGPMFYVFGKLLGDPSRRADDLFQEYVKGVYGKAASPMMAFYQNLYKRLADYCLVDRPLFQQSGRSSATGFRGSPEHYFCHVFAPDLLVEMDGFLKNARKRATDPKVKEAVKMVEPEFEYLKRTATVYHVYRSYRVRPSRALLDLLARTIEERREFIDSMYDPKGKPKFRLAGGLPSPFTVLTKKQVLAGGRKTLLDKPPFNWDFAMLKESGLLPGTEKLPEYETPRAAAPVMDGRLNDPVWQKAEFATLKDMSLGSVRNPTRFKALHDDEALYIGVECELNSLDVVKKLKPQGKDGRAWADECVEILLDPLGDRQRHVQLVFNPVPNSTYDARYGYIEDPVHPLYGKREVTWNGDWSYAPFIDEKAMLWSAEVRIPFETLGVSPPPSGAIWTMNLGRTECPPGHGYGGKGKGPILSVWSPNLKARGYHDRSCYGELIFE